MTLPESSEAAYLVNQSPARRMSAWTIQYRTCRLPIKQQSVGVACQAGPRLRSPFSLARDCRVSGLLFFRQLKSPFHYARQRRHCLTTHPLGRGMGVPPNFRRSAAGDLSGCACSRAGLDLLPTAVFFRTFWRRAIEPLNPGRSQRKRKRANGRAPYPPARGLRSHPARGSSPQPKRQVPGGVHLDP